MIPQFSKSLIISNMDYEIDSDSDSDSDGYNYNYNNNTNNWNSLIRDKINRLADRHSNSFQIGRAHV